MAGIFRFYCLPGRHRSARLLEVSVCALSLLHLPRAGVVRDTVPGRPGNMAAGVWMSARPSCPPQGTHHSLWQHRPKPEHRHVYNNILFYNYSNIHFYNSKQQKQQSFVCLFVWILHPGKIYGWYQEDTNMRQCALMATFIVLPNWEIRPLAPWPNMSHSFTLSRHEQTSPRSILLMLSVQLGRD